MPYLHFGSFFNQFSKMIFCIRNRTRLISFARHDYDDDDDRK